VSGGKPRAYSLPWSNQSAADYVQPPSAWLFSGGLNGFGIGSQWALPT
jgi:hypothetical protein